MTDPRRYMNDFPIRHVSDTARWVAIYRAMESERPDAIFNDPYARRLGGTHGETIVRTLKRGAKMAWPMIVRTAVMDEIITRLVSSGQANTVLNLAAGLDTRAWRLDLPPSLRWFEVDLPGITAYKREQLASETPRCAFEWVEADLRDADVRTRVFDLAAAPDAAILVITEGLLVYLARDEVTALAADLGARPAMRHWLTDLGSPRLQKMMQRTWGRQMEHTGAPFRFFPPEGTAFFEPHGWTEREFRSMWEESFRLNRTMQFGWLWRLLSRMSSRKQIEEGRRMSGIVLLGRP